MLDRFLFRYIDNSALIVFRIFFGGLIFLEAIGAILTGWVTDTLVDPQFTFSFIGFEWLQPLPGNGMYFYFAIMGIFGFMVMIGYKYRLSIIAFSLLWTATYLMQKTSYNNHYYLLVLLCGFMCVVPAHRYWSVDAKLNPGLRRINMPNWCRWIFILQMFIVYTYAAVAKIYPDWLDTSFIEILLKTKSHYYVIGDLLQQKWMHYFIVYSGILFDALIIPLLLWKPSRKWAFGAAVFFHLFNSIVFQIGIFPYMSLALCLFFFEPKTIRNIFLKRKEIYTGHDIKIPTYRNAIITVIVIYFSIQLALPLRHHAFEDEVLWTEEGHRLSWRMMLRSRFGKTSFKVVDKATNNVTAIKLKEHLTPKQIRFVSTHPDAIWQFSQYLKSKFEAEGKTVEIYVDSHVKINKGKFERLIDPQVDLAAVHWKAFRHSPWILPSKLDRTKAANP
ncbi:MAG: HTTM domain-containing protein [Flavobacteriaceae bacterium]|nr:HTTM domain-containing protein [Flavobacteriaceae bacterium]